MEYEEFVREMLRRVKAKAASEYKVTLTQKEKNNGIREDVICIEEAGNAAIPAIYLAGFYERYQSGALLDQLADQLLEHYETIRDSAKQFSPESFLDYHKACTKIYLQLVNLDMNRELLSRIPWSPFLDLAEIFYYELNGSSIPDGSILISRLQLDFWGITELELKQIALVNTLRDKPAYFTRLSILMEKMCQGDPDFPVSDGTDMYVLTTEGGFGGAIAIRYPQVAGNIAEELDDDYYLLPSSIHEWIILPAGCGIGREEMTNMVQAVNREEVPPQDVLADHIYYYNRKLHHIEIC